jgi:hypothetical protein
LDVIVTVTTSPLVSDEEAKVELFDPTGIPSTLHRYEGIPPLTGVAVKVTNVPEQTGPAGLATILTLAAIEGLTVIVPPADADPHPPEVVTV